MATITTAGTILKIMKEGLKSQIKLYYNGQLKPSDIVNVDLPVLTIEKLETEFDREGTGTLRDNVVWRYRVVVWANRKDYLDNLTSEPEEMNTVQNFLESIVEGLDKDLNYKADTVIGILRKNLPIEGKVFYTNNVRASYENYVTEQEYQLAKAVIEFEAFHKVTRQR